MEGGIRISNVFFQEATQIVMNGPEFFTLSRSLFMGKLALIFLLHIMLGNFNTDIYLCLGKFLQCYSSRRVYALHNLELRGR